MIYVRKSHKEVCDNKVIKWSFIVHERKIILISTKDFILIFVTEKDDKISEHIVDSNIIILIKKDT